MRIAIFFLHPKADSCKSSSNLQAVNWTGAKFVGGLSSIDSALEDAEVLKKLDPEKPLGTDEDMIKDCNEVSRQPLSQLS